MSADVGQLLTCDEVVDSLSAYALGALDRDEVDAIDAHLAGCEACRRELARELETVGALAAMTVPLQPSPDVRRRLLDDALDQPGARRPDPIPISEARGARRMRWMFAAASVAAAILLVGVGVLGVLLERAMDDREESQNAAQLLATYISSGGQVVTLEAQPATIYETYQGQGSLLIAPGMDPAVVVAECPQSGENLTYRVWFARNGDRTGVGALTVGNDGSGWLKIDPALDLSQFDTIGITAILEDDRREDVLVAPLNNPTREG